MENEIDIKLMNIEEMVEFNTVISKFEYDFDLEQGRYYVDAKSILGIMSLNPAAKMKLHFKAGKADKKRVEMKIKKYITTQKEKKESEQKGKNDL